MELLHYLIFRCTKRSSILLFESWRLNWKTKLICFNNTVVRITENKKLLKKGNVITARYTNEICTVIIMQKMKEDLIEKLDISEFVRHGGETQDSIVLTSILC